MTDENVQKEQNAENASSQPEGGSAPSQPIAAASPPAKKPRSSTERLIVWGVIGVLLLVAVVEAHAKLSYDATIASLENIFENDEEGEVVSVAQLDGLLKGFETRSEITKEGLSYVIECRWKSMLKDYTIHIIVSEDDPQKATLISYSTPNAEPEPVTRDVPSGYDPEDEDPEAAEQMARMGGAYGGGGGGQGGGGGGGGRRPRGMMGQLADEAVQVELKLTDEQKSKIEELGQGSRPNFSQMSADERTAFFQERRQKTEADIKGILNEVQFARVRQLTLRAAGLTSLGQSDVQADLKLTDEQKETLSKIIAEQRTARRSLGREGSPEQRQKIFDGWNAEITAVLTDEQKLAWENLLGAPPAKAEATAAKEE